MKNAFQDEGFLWDLLSMESMESHWLLAMLTKQHHTECKQPSTRRHLSLQKATGGFSSVQIRDLMHCGKKGPKYLLFFPQVPTQLDSTRDTKLTSIKGSHFQLQREKAEADSSGRPLQQPDNFLPFPGISHSSLLLFQ